MWTIQPLAVWVLLLAGCSVLASHRMGRDSHQGRRRATEPYPLMKLCEPWEIREAVYAACRLTPHNKRSVDDRWIRHWPRSQQIDYRYSRDVDHTIIRRLRERTSSRRTKRMTMPDLIEKCCEREGCRLTEFIGFCPYK